MATDCFAMLSIPAHINLKAGFWRPDGSNIEIHAGGESSALLLVPTSLGFHALIMCVYIIQYISTQHLSVEFKFDLADMLPVTLDYIKHRWQSTLVFCASTIKFPAAFQTSQHLL